MIISSATVGNIIVLPTRGGPNGTSVTVINDSGPGTLSWTQIASQTGPTDWVHSVHCATVPTSGTYTFHTTNNSSGSIPSIRSLAVELNTGQCAGAQFKGNIGSSYGRQAADPNVQNLAVGQTSLLFSSVAN